MDDWVPILFWKHAIPIVTSYLAHPNLFQKMKQENGENLLAPFETVLLKKK